MDRLHLTNMTLYPVHKCSDDLPELNCAWKVDEDGFGTSCGHWHDSDDGYPEQDILYCPYCNKKICLETDDGSE